MELEFVPMQNPRIVFAVQEGRDVFKGIPIDIKELPWWDDVEAVRYESTRCDLTYKQYNGIYYIYDLVDKLRR